MATRTSDPDDLLPLRPAVFSILMVLREGPLHGYGIMQRANEHVGRQAACRPHFVLLVSGFDGHSH